MALYDWARGPSETFGGSVDSREFLLGKPAATWATQWTDAIGIGSELSLNPSVDLAIMGDGVATTQQSERVAVTLTPGSGAATGIYFDGPAEDFTYGARIGFNTVSAYGSHTVWAGFGMLEGTDLSTDLGRFGSLNRGNQRFSTGTFGAAESAAGGGHKFTNASYISTGSDIVMKRNMLDVFLQRKSANFFVWLAEPGGAPFYGSSWGVTADTSRPIFFRFRNDDLTHTDAGGPKAYIYALRRMSAIPR